MTRKMKVNHIVQMLALSGGLIAITPQAMAEDDLTLGANVAIVSDYRFRGVSQSDEKLAIQGGLDVAHSSGFYLSTWGSSINDFNGSETELDIYGGCYAPRKKRGGSTWSTHAWAIALDFDPDRNQLNWGRDKASFARPEYDDWWDCWEAEGWVSLGRERNFDWMHVQAAKLKT